MRHQVKRIVLPLNGSTRTIELWLLEEGYTVAVNGKVMVPRRALSLQEASKLYAEIVNAHVRAENG